MNIAATFTPPRRWRQQVRRCYRVLLRLWGAVWFVVEIVAGLIGIPIATSPRSSLERRLRKEPTYAQWFVVARILDEMDGFNTWCTTETSRYFNYDGLAAHIQHLAELKRSGDAQRLLNTLSSTLHRPLFGITNSKLYTYRTGTKAAIHTYTSLTTYLIRSFKTNSEADIERWYGTIREVSLVYGKTALILSGGVILGGFHLGVVKALHEAKLLPSVVYGSRAGALVAALVCCENDASSVVDGERIDFSAFARQDNRNVFQRRWRRLWTEGTIMDVNILLKFAKDNLGEWTFLEAYKRTGRILNIQYPVLNQGGKRSQWLLNYLTAPNVLIYTAAAASFATTPLLFKQAPLLARNLDGSISTFDLPAIRRGTTFESATTSFWRIRELFNVKLFITSECSTKRLPLMQVRYKASTPMRLLHCGIEECMRLVGAIVRQTRAKRYLEFFFEGLDIMEGDVVVFPVSSLYDLVSLLVNPSRERIRDRIALGERSMWPHLEQIRTQMSIEIALHEVATHMAAARPSIADILLFPY